MLQHLFLTFMSLMAQPVMSELAAVVAAPVVPQAGLHRTREADGLHTRVATAGKCSLFATAATHKLHAPSADNTRTGCCMQAYQCTQRFCQPLHAGLQ